MKLDEVKARRAFAIVHAQSIELLAESADGAVRGCHSGADLIESRPGVEQRQVLRRVEQLLVFVLAVELDEAVGKILERRGRGERAVDEGAAAALRGDLATDDQLVATP